MGYKTRGSHKKYTPKGRSRYVATVEEIIARNQQLSDDDGVDRGGSDPSQEDPEEVEEGEESEYEPLIEVFNPNKTRRNVDKTGIVELSRREKEELKRQKFEREKMKLMAEGKLPSAKADLERLAKIRKEREEAMARKMEKLKLAQNP